MTSIAISGASGKLGRMVIQSLRSITKQPLVLLMGDSSGNRSRAQSVGHFMGRVCSAAYDFRGHADAIEAPRRAVTQMWTASPPCFGLLRFQA